MQEVLITQLIAIIYGIVKQSWLKSVFAFVLARFIPPLAANKLFSLCRIDIVKSYKIHNGQWINSYRTKPSQWSTAHLSVSASNSIESISNKQFFFISIEMIYIDCVNHMVSNDERLSHQRDTVREMMKKTNRNTNALPSGFSNDHLKYCIENEMKMVYTIF